jgi:16S rRNA (guanine527-N7)-methyltransferase
MLDQMRDLAASYGVRLTDEEVEQLRRYYALLMEWSARVNLVGSIDEATVVKRHFVESIALGAALREREVLRPTSVVLDLGSGAGLPGIPIKIAWPEIRLTLMDATAKKTAFLSACAEGLGLKGTAVETGRAEDGAHAERLRERFDLVLARSVAPLPTLVELGLPFLRVGGRLIAPKGSRAEDELAGAKRALEMLGAKAFVVPFLVPGPKQVLVAVLKQRETPAEYPRRAGTPSKRPL